jgi:hypothetical protein
MTDTLEPLDAEDAVAILRDYSRRLQASTDPHDMATTLERIADTIDDLRQKLHDLQYPRRG